ncbi:N-6 DNA methylase [Streptomyces sp. NPDC086023]|uniref:N-6 DNA methylase n=1 Tax=Streptomyces sp. NPDC086023 TaxID=3365746 RepID=UPI0037CF2773
MSDELYDTEDPHITRSQIAKLAGVSRPTVTSWERQSDGFPAPRSAGEMDYFLRSEVLDWLDLRPVPLHLRQSGEGDNTTYGSRARRSLARGSEKASPQATPSSAEAPGPTTAPRPQDARQRRGVVQELMGTLADRVGGPGMEVNYLQLLLGLLFLRVARRDQWAAVRARTAKDAADERPPGELLGRVGDVLDGELRRMGGLPRFKEVLSRLMPRSAQDVVTVVDLVGELSRDAYQMIIDEYEKHARLGSREFFTPHGAVALMAVLATASHGGEVRTVYDPYVRGGEFLAHALTAASRTQEHGPGHTPPKVFGQTSGRDAAVLASLNLALHGVGSGVRLTQAKPWADAANVLGKTDLVLTNPPFNMKDSAGDTRRGGEWAYGAPPLDNDNFAYVQHALAALREGGRAAIVMPIKAGNSGGRADTEIRRAMVEAGVVECVVAMPANLFTGTAVPVSVWLLRHPSDPCDRVLFLDAGHLGTKRARIRVLGEEDVLAVRDAYVSRRPGESGQPNACSSETPDPQRAVPSALVGREEIQAQGWSLNPLDHIRPTEQDGQVVPGSDEDPAAEAWDHMTFLTERAREADAVVAALRGEVPPAETSGGTWRVEKLADLCEIKAGPSYTRVSKKDRGPDGVVPMVFPQHLREGRVTDTGEERVSLELADRLRGFWLEEGDVVCVRAGKTAPPAIVRGQQAGWLMSQNLIRLRGREGAGLEPDYLLAWLHRPHVLAWIKDRSAATAVPSISTTALGRLEVRLPPLAEQRRIAALLTALEEQAHVHQELAAAVARTRGLFVEQFMSAE